jgi:DNA ligase-1
VTLLADVVATSAAVSATSARTAKIGALAELLGRLEPDEVEIAVGFLTGVIRHGAIGVGWATASKLDGTATQPSVDVARLHDVFGTLLITTGAGSQAQRAALLADLGARLTSGEADFARRLLTGELRQGALAGVMAEAIAKAAEVPASAVRRAAMLTGDLGTTAALALDGGRDALDATSLTVNRPVQPMLASTAADVAEAIADTGMSSVEWKLDGARIQAHRDGDHVALYTRNLNDVTDRLPAVVALLRSLPHHQLILDGEVMGVDDDGLPHAFQDTISTFSRQTMPTNASAAPLTIGFFDCLLLDSHKLLDEPLSTRQDALASIDGLPAIPGIRTDDPDAAQAVLDEALAAGHEGVMVKDLASPYAAGRRGKSWRKVKPVHTLDLVVLAAEWGSGRRRGWLSNLHLGALDEHGTPTMVGKTFKGLTDALLTWQTERFLELEDRRDAHTVYVRPELVVEIALDGAQVSTRYPGGVALRFARVRRYRADKDASEADTLGAVRALLPRARR